MQKAANNNNKLDIKPIRSNRCFRLLKAVLVSIERNFNTTIIKAPKVNIIGENLISNTWPIEPKTVRILAIM